MGKSQIKLQITSPNHKSFQPKSKENKIMMSIKCKKFPIQQIKSYLSMITKRKSIQNVQQKQSITLQTPTMAF